MLVTFLLAICLGVTAGCRETFEAMPAASTSAIPPANASAQVGEQARPADSFVDSVGANVHLNYFDTVYGNFDVVKQRLVALGVRHLRDGAQLTADLNYNNIFYDRLRELAQSGIRTDLIFDPRSSVGELTANKLTAITVLARNSLEAIEGPNEYDNSQDAGWARTLSKYQANLYQLAKTNSATRSLPVIGPSFVRAQSRDAIGDLTPYLDYGNLHSYPGGKSPASNLQSEITLNRKISHSRPLIPTETGYHTAVASASGQPGVSDQAAAKYLLRLYLEYLNQGFERTYWYEFADEKPDPGRIHPEQNFGLITFDGEPKPAYSSLRNVIQLLDDKGPAFSPGKLKYQLQGDTSDIHHTLLQKRNGRFYLILWCETSSYDLATKVDIKVPARHLILELGSGVGQANTYLPLQSSQVVRQYNKPGSLPLDVPDHPLVVEVVP
jgi:hypothetical protein